RCYSRNGQLWAGYHGADDATASTRAAVNVLRSNWLSALTAKYWMIETTNDRLCITWNSETNRNADGTWLLWERSCSVSILGRTASRTRGNSGCGKAAENTTLRVG